LLLLAGRRSGGVGRLHGRRRVAHGRLLHERCGLLGHLAITPVATALPQPGAAFAALAHEDKAQEPAPVEVADLLEGHAQAPARVGPDDSALARDRQHSGSDRDLEAHLVADLQRALSGEQKAAAAEVDRVAAELLAVAAGVDRDGPRGGDAHVLALL